ncbi:MAG: scpB [Candidatus Kaiserbacteria bacterium]|nr:scpB [Candidatus Kaiserbacteria bacterium]
MTTPVQTANQINALLFAEGGSLSISYLAKSLNVDESAIVPALEILSARLNGTGLTLIRTATEVSLAVGQEESALLREQYEKELGLEIGDAGLEVLSIILYRNGVSKSEIDYIRGVNCATTIRNLLARGLVERISRGARQYVYAPTTQLLAHLGVRSPEELPDYATIIRSLSDVAQTAENSDVFHGNSNTTDTARDSS